MINESFGALLQIFVFALIPLLVYLIQKKTIKGFFEYIGLKKSTKKANFYAVLACFIIAIPMLLLTITNADFMRIMFEPTSITGKFRQMEFGFNSVILIVIIAVFKTSFSEELLFRGYIAKRCICLLGYKKGNLLQAFIFGIIHTILFVFITTNIFFLAVIFIIPSIGAYVSVYLNEKMANGSIFPGWISHALANILAYTIVGFVI